MRVECHDMGEGAAEGEGLSRLAQSVDEGIFPGAAVSDVTENAIQFGIGLFEPLQHGLRRALRLGRTLHIHIGSGGTYIPRSKIVSLRFGTLHFSRPEHHRCYFSTLTIQRYRIFFTQGPVPSGRWYPRSLAG